MDSQHDVEFQLKTGFVMSIWDPSFFNADRTNNPIFRSNGIYVASVIRSIWSYIHSDVDIVSASAEKLCNHLEGDLQQVKHHFTECHNQIKKEHDDLKNNDPIKINDQTVEVEKFFIEKNKGCPIVFELVRAFVLFDETLWHLSELRRLGALGGKQFFKRRKEVAKPIRRFANDTAFYGKRFHEKRKEVAK